jgi:cell wall-associated NlpC family hydrolase
MFYANKGALMTTCAIAVGVANVRREPAPTAELVTQVLRNTPAQVGETCDAWTHVTLPDYAGWVCSDELAEPAIKGFTKVGAHCATPLDLVAVVAATHTPLYADSTGEETIGTAYLSSVLPLLDTTPAECLQVALPGAQSAWIARGAVTIRRGELAYPRAPVSVVTTYARAFIGVPYLWGGTSWAGIDCSGLVQLCYRMGGYSLPRDADQQHDALAHTIERSQMREGDLIFFGHPTITHVAMALNEQEYIHAEGQHFNRVVISSFEPTAEHYYRRLDEIVYAIKRVV